MGSQISLWELLWYKVRYKKRKGRKEGSKEREKERKGRKERERKGRKEETANLLNAVYEKKVQKKSNHDIVFELGDKYLPNHVNSNINLPKICDII